MLRKTTTAVLLNILALTFASWSVRGAIPTPGLSYVQRLELLRGWSTKGYSGYNCSGFITHAARQPYRESEELYAGKGDTILLAEYTNKKFINETMLIPGDFAVFQGASYAQGNGDGVHCAAYLGDGVWIDSDGRRGNVAMWRMNEKPNPDPWFAGSVKIFQWRQK